MASGSLAAVFLRGDGALSARENGLIQGDALQNITGSVRTTYGAIGGGEGALLASAGISDGAPQFNTTNVGGRLDFNASRSVRTAAETRPLNVTGVWTIHAFAAVANGGSVDIAQLVSDHAALNAAFQTLRAQVFGVGQTLQDMGASRAFGVTYTNSTGRPISVYIVGSSNSSSGGNMYVMVGGIAGTRSITTMNGVSLALTAVIPRNHLSGGGRQHDAEFLDRVPVRLVESSPGRWQRHLSAQSHFFPAARIRGWLFHFVSRHHAVRAFLPCKS